MDKIDRDNFSSSGVTFGECNVRPLQFINDLALLTSKKGISNMHLIGFLMHAWMQQVKVVGSVVEWLKRRAHDQHRLSSKLTRAILLCPWEKHFTPLSPTWWSWKAVLNFNHISIKFQADSNILASPEAGHGNCLPYVLAPLSRSCKS